MHNGWKKGRQGVGGGQDSALLCLIKSEPEVAFHFLYLRPTVKKLLKVYNDIRVKLIPLALVRYINLSWLLLPTQLHESLIVALAQREPKTRLVVRVNVRCLVKSDVNIHLPVASIWVELNDCWYWHIAFEFLAGSSIAHISPRQITIFQEFAG